MTKQIGSIILILLIVITLTSITSAVVLQSDFFFKKQINLSMLQQEANEISKAESTNKATNIMSGVNLNLLPNRESINHQFESHQFTTTQLTTKTLQINFPLNGYSLNSAYKTQLVEIITTTSSSMIKSRNITNGLGCSVIEDIELSKQIEPTYSLDINQDSINDVSYQFDSSSGDIVRADASDQLLINLTLDAEQSFSRPQFSKFNFANDSKLALAFAVQNTGIVAETSKNYFYLLFDKSLTDLSTQLPISPNNLIDLDTNPTFSFTEKGYYLKLDQGQLISSAITIFNHQIILITQSPSTNPNTGFTQYTNRLITINLATGSTIQPSIEEITSSVDLLEIRSSTLDHLAIILSSQLEPLVNLPGECRPLYQYES